MKRFLSEYLLKNYTICFDAIIHFHLLFLNVTLAT
jgi:hypothetical protein